MPVVPLWSAASPSALAIRLQWTLQWLFTLGEPYRGLPDDWGVWAGLLEWAKILALFSLLGWSCAWVVSAIKERVVPYWLNVAALASVIGFGGTVLLTIMQGEGQLKVPNIAGVNAIDLASWAFRLVVLAWAEWALWAVIPKVGNRYDVATLLGVHLALVGGVLLGGSVFASLDLQTRGGILAFILGVPAAEVNGILLKPTLPRQYSLVFGARMAATFMGYVVLLRILGLLLREVAAVRVRRLYSLGWHTVVESYRRMWAPWVVLAIFLVVLAFIHWFLIAPRPAEQGRLFVGTLALLGSLLLTIMVVILTPISLPHDIQQQTIYTVVSKPVRRLEVVWGRMLGFMALVTALLLVFGGISLAYLDRTISKSIEATRADAEKARKEGRLPRARFLDEQADQLKTRQAARVIHKGVLTFRDSRGDEPNLPELKKGVNVGQEMEFRSHIEGATQSLARWRFGVLHDPNLPDNIAGFTDRRLPIDALLVRGTVEDVANRLALARVEEATLKAARGEAATTDGARRLVQVGERIRELEAERDGLARRAAEYEGQVRAAEAKNEDASGPRQDLARLHTPPIPLEMTFNIFRTTKGQVLGAPVHAEIKLRRLFPARVPGDTVLGEVIPGASRLLPIREYYTNRVEVPASALVGTGGYLAIEVRCLEPNQYLGMAESDMYFLSNKGNFELNYMKGLTGVWLQAMVLTAIGVFAGTFLSWPVALLTTIFFFIAGQVAFGFLQEFAMNSLVGGGPFESLVRLLSHENMMNKMAATPGVVTAKALDALVMPVMSRLVYIVPNFGSMDVSNTVADGFAVEWGMLRDHLLTALAYALPFSVAGYFILKNREVAA